jgi:hypothetical protein
MVLTFKENSVFWGKYPWVEETRSRTNIIGIPQVLKFVCLQALYLISLCFLSSKSGHLNG